MTFVFVCAVAVGYVYEGCARRPYWHVQSAKIAGNDMMSSEIGGWNIDVHHVYSVQEGNVAVPPGSLIIMPRPHSGDIKR